jgi:hypothetical protein
MGNALESPPKSSSQIIGYHALQTRLADAACVGDRVHGLRRLAWRSAQNSAISHANQ